mmetsp:Transcript_4916/g.8401  ORF Transcript_4916/g.8401 Transcript_4916/m.8401 type:complete len:102 (+) Transcript_4916:1411-1716(+)
MEVLLLFCRRVVTTALLLKLKLFISGMMIIIMFIDSLQRFVMITHCGAYCYWRRRADGSASSWGFFVRLGHHLVCLEREREWSVGDDLYRGGQTSKLYMFE